MQSDEILKFQTSISKQVLVLHQALINTVQYLHKLNQQNQELRETNQKLHKTNDSLRRNIRELDKNQQNVLRYLKDNMTNT